MDNRNVSTIGIGEGIDYIQQQFIAPLNEDVDEVISTYTQMQSQGSLSSANIDSIAQGIKSRITMLEDNFNTLAQNLKNNMFQSQEQIEAHRRDIENQMNQGM